MRVGLIWAAAPRLVNISVRFERYVRGFRAIGCDPLTVCLPGAAAGYPHPVHPADPQDFADPAFWKSLGLDAAVIVSWLRLPEVVAALKQSGAFVVSLADSDGQVGARVHPGAVFRRMVAMHRTWGLRLRGAKYFLQLYLYGAPAQDAPALESATAADRVIVGCPRAIGHLRRFFHHYRRPDLADKVAAVPYPIDECYLQGDVPAAREDRVLAIGRWDDPQKDARLLRRAVSRYYRHGGKAEVAILGPGGESWFAALCGRFPQARYLGIRPPEFIGALLRSSRVLLLPSRWESGPIVLNEALASGCTVVGTDSVPALRSACDEGGFGTVSAGRSAAGLAAALRVELGHWECGLRNPAAIAGHWRPRFDPAAVCRRLLAGAPLGGAGRCEERAVESR